MTDLSPEDITGPIAVGVELQAGDSNEIVSQQLATLLDKKTYPMSYAIGLDVEHDPSDGGMGVSFKVVCYGPADAASVSQMLLMCAEAIKNGAPAYMEWHHKDGSICTGEGRCEKGGEHGE